MYERSHQSPQLRWSPFGSVRLHWYRTTFCVRTVSCCGVPTLSPGCRQQYIRGRQQQGLADPLDVLVWPLGGLISKTLRVNRAISDLRAVSLLIYTPRFQLYANNLPLKTG